MNRHTAWLTLSASLGGQAASLHLWDKCSPGHGVIYVFILDPTALKASVEAYHRYHLISVL